MIWINWIKIFIIFSVFVSDKLRACIHTHTHTHTYIYICEGEGNGKPLQCSCLENPRDGRAWWAAVYGVAQSRTQLKWLSNSNIYIYISGEVSKTGLIFETLLYVHWIWVSVFLSMAYKSKASIDIFSLIDWQQNF